MEQVLKLAENYVMQRVMSNHAPLTHANKVAMVLPILIGALVVIGASLCLFGLYLWLLTIMPLHSALSILGGVFMTFAILLIVGFIYLNRIKRKKTKQARKQLINDVKLIVKSLDSELSKIGFIQDNPKICVSAAIILGHMTSNRLRE